MEFSENKKTNSQEIQWNINAKDKEPENCVVGSTFNSCDRTVLAESLLLPWVSSQHGKTHARKEIISNIIPYANQEKLEEVSALKEKVHVQDGFRTKLPPRF